jgi:hypothetical protein
MPFKKLINVINNNNFVLQFNNASISSKQWEIKMKVLGFFIFTFGIILILYPIIYPMILKISND